MSEDRDSKIVKIPARLRAGARRYQQEKFSWSSLADDYLPKQVVSPPTLIIGHLEGL